MHALKSPTLIQYPTECTYSKVLLKCSVALVLVVTYDSFVLSLSDPFWWHSVGDFEKIWREHCEDEQTLSEYAMAMRNLADNYWTKNSEGEVRIEWCRR